LARAAFSEEGAALVSLLEEGFERLREAGELIAEHLSSLRGAIRPTDPTAGASPEATEKHPTPRR
jgi:hypothetical protein